MKPIDRAITKRKPQRAAKERALPLPLAFPVCPTSAFWLRRGFAPIARSAWLADPIHCVCPGAHTILDLRHDVARQFRKWCPQHGQLHTASDERRMPVFQIGPIMSAAYVTGPRETAQQVRLLNMFEKLVCGDSLDPCAGTPKNQAQPDRQAHGHSDYHPISHRVSGGCVKMARPRGVEPRFQG